MTCRIIFGKIVISICIYFKHTKKMYEMEAKYGNYVEEHDISSFVIDAIKRHFKQLNNKKMLK